MENDRYERGKSLLMDINANNAEKLVESLKDVAPDMHKYVFEFAYGDIYSRPGLDIKTRELATVAALTAMGHLPQLQSHIEASLNTGWTKEEIVEVIMQMAVYAGFPAALNALTAADEVFKRRQ
ncbi:carboxymuconolactone decarboxylase family protein [Methanocella sp. MCL-LM]|uniref:carboxymuconolactone decarboxylase family protein n=1 Tax=Methanocella sp. MCL-LM TaxID=3412035 RepID=UPI003C70A66A